MNITELCNKYETDKGTISKHYPAHGYSQIYEDLFSPLKEKELKIIELGLFQLDKFNRRDIKGGPRSLYVWRDYFPNAHIYGLDILDGRSFSEERITVVQCDATDKEQIDKLFDSIEFDIVIDDASHKNDLIVESQKIFWPKLKDDGYYIIEDIKPHILDNFKVDNSVVVKTNDVYDSNLAIMKK